MLHNSDDLLQLQFGLLISQFWGERKIW